jgi:hypothetical protein
LHFFYDFVNNTTSNIYEWCAKDLESEIHNLQNVPVDFITQWLNARKNGKVFYVKDGNLLREDGGLVCLLFWNYKGSIWLESKEGVETTFYFTLPK